MDSEPQSRGSVVALVMVIAAAFALVNYEIVSCVQLTLLCFHAPFRFKLSINCHIESFLAQKNMCKSTIRQNIFLYKTSQIHTIWPQVERTIIMCVGITGKVGITEFSPI